MNITAKEIAHLREKTGLPMMEVKAALVEANGNEEAAIEILRKRGMSKSMSRADKLTSNGVIDSYVHSGRIGVLTEVLCETDFVARNEDFKAFVHELSLQIAATNPKYVERNQVPEVEITKEKEFYTQQAKSSGKPEAVIEKIIEGKLETYFAEICLIDQSYFRDPKKRISDILAEITAKTGEKIVISRFVRFELS